GADLRRHAARPLQGRGVAEVPAPQRDQAARAGRLMRLSCGFPPTASAPEHAALAEQLGYERVWFYDSPALYGDVWVALARAADATRRIGLGTAGLVPEVPHLAAAPAARGPGGKQARGRPLLSLRT